MSESTAKILDRNFSSSESKRGPLFSGLLLSALVATMYAPVLRFMAQQWWDDPNYGHALIVPVFVAYILWREYPRWRSVASKGNDAGLPIMFLALGLLMLGMLAAELFTTRMSLLILIAGMIVFLAGWQMLRSLAFPLGYLLFMIPLPALVYYQLTFPLQLWASWLGAHGLVMLGVHTVRQGNLLILPNATLEVVEACSGVRSLLSLLAAVVAYGFVTEKKLGIRSLLAVLTVPVVIVSNGLRLVATGVLSFKFGTQVDSGLIHTMLVLAFYLLALVSIILAHRVLGHVLKRRTLIPEN